MTKDEMLAIKDGLDHADTKEPFLYTEDNDIKVVGDANNTKVTSHDYSLVFETEDGERVESTFQNIYVTPRKRTGVVRLLTKMIPYFRAADSKGNVRTLSNQEFAETMAGMGDEVYAVIYELAGTLLDLPNEMVECIDPISALKFAAHVIYNNPAAVQEAEMSFDWSSVSSPTERN